jgi:hypothetical protein
MRQQVENRIPNINGIKDIGIQAFYMKLHLGVGYHVIAYLMSCDMWGQSTCTCLIHCCHRW